MSMPDNVAKRKRPRTVSSPYALFRDAVKQQSSRGNARARIFFALVGILLACAVYWIPESRLLSLLEAIPTGR